MSSSASSPTNPDLLWWWLLLVVVVVVQTGHSLAVLQSLFPSRGSCLLKAADLRVQQSTTLFSFFFFFFFLFQPGCNEGGWQEACPPPPARLGRQHRLLCGQPGQFSRVFIESLELLCKKNISCPAVNRRWCCVALCLCTCCASVMSRRLCAETSPALPARQEGDGVPAPQTHPAGPGGL